jgi:phosphoenolpyruvate-protein kinase (PTS system EI component)
VDEPEQEDIHLWRAQGAAPGVVEGRCYCIRSRDDLRSIPPDRILCVADEGMIGLGLYLNASCGIILESGNWLCHTINLCRELGIPAVVGAGSLVKELNHQVVQIDGAKGIIRVRPENK